MSEHNDTEARLRAALRAKADTVTESSLHRADPPGSGRGGRTHDLGAARRRLRRSAPLLIAAAVIIAVAGTAATVTSLQGDRQQPATTPTPTTSTSPAPTGSPGPSAITPTGSAKTRQAPPAGSPNTTTVRTHVVTFGGVSITVPATWDPAPTSNSDGTGYLDQCLTVGGVARTRHTGNGPTNDNCQLTIDVLPPRGALDPDQPSLIGQGFCG